MRVPQVAVSKPQCARSPGSLVVSDAKRLLTFVSRPKTTLRELGQRFEGLGVARLLKHGKGRVPRSLAYGEWRARPRSSLRWGLHNQASDEGKRQMAK